MLKLILNWPVPSYVPNVEGVLLVKGPAVSVPEVKVPDENTSVPDPCAPRVWLPVVYVAVNSGEAKLNPGSALPSVKLELVVPLAVCAVWVLFVSVMDPIMSPLMVIVTPVSSALVGSNWLHVIVALDNSTPWIRLEQLTVWVAAAANPEAASKNTPSSMVRPIEPDTKRFARIRKNLPTLAAYRDEW